LIALLRIGVLHGHLLSQLILLRLLLRLSMLLSRNLLLPKENLLLHVRW
jgi:hypothetical protein